MDIKPRQAIQIENDSIIENLSSVSLTRFGYINSVHREVFQKEYVEYDKKKTSIQVEYIVCLSL